MTPPPEPSNFLDQGSGDFLRGLDAMRNSFYAGMVSGAEVGGRGTAISSRCSNRSTCWPINSVWM